MIVFHPEQSFGTFWCKECVQNEKANTVVDLFNTIMVFVLSTVTNWSF